MVHRRLLRVEKDIPERLLGLACFVSLCSLVLVCTRKPLFSVALAAGSLLALRRVSQEKFRFLRMHLHVYDFALMAQGRSTILFLFHTVPWLILGIFLRLAVSLVLLGLLLSRDRFLVPPLVACILLGGSLAATLLAWRRAPVPSFVGHFGDFRLTDFLRSIPEALQALGRGGVLTREAPKGELPRLDAEGPQEVPESCPTLLVILNESTFPPDLFQPTPISPSRDAFFRSSDGRARQLRVETFGGGTWMSAFSLMTGIPASTYGRFRAHVMRWSQGRIRHSLPATLKALGYRSVVLSPLGGDFVGEEPFYRSLGFDDFLDQKDLGTQGDREPDAFYLSKALDWLGDHFAHRDDPAFLFLMTMANHHPHGGEGAPFVDYLQRLDGTAQAYQAFKSSLADRFPDRAFLILHFGDHQPPFTWPARDEVDWMNRVEGLPLEESAYRTYFAVDGVGFAPRQLDRMPDLLEVAYLGTALLSAAGLPLDAVHRLRRDLALRHSGRLFFADADGAMARQFNQRLIEAGLLDAH